MARAHAPRHGSLAFRPRKRASSQVPRIRNWPSVDTPIALGFAGYKVGMTHVTMIDDSNSATKGLEIVVPCTVIETPPMVVYGIRGYGKDYLYKTSLLDVHAGDEKLLEKLRVKSDDISKLENKLEELLDLTLLACTQPYKTGIGKKKPEVMEIAIGGKSVQEKFEYAKSVLGKELSVGEVFKEGEYVDVIAVTKGKGWQGPVKRFGVDTQRRKATGRIRHVGTLGPWHPARVMYYVPQAGQMGYHRRTELNKRILKIGVDPSEINVKGGFLHYGVVRNAYVLLKGSVPGPQKRLIRLRKALRMQGVAPVKPEIKYISLESKQGARR